MPAHRHRRTLPTLVLATIGPLALLGACGNTQRAADSESILGLLPAPPSPAEAAAWFFDPYDPDKRFRGTVLLANAPFGGEDVYIKGYLDHLKDSDASVRAAAAFALGMHGNPEHVPEIVPLASDPDRIVRLSSARALQRLHNPVAITPLLERLDPAKEIEADIRAESASALGQYAEPRVLQGLIRGLADERLTVTRNSAQSLATLTGQNFGEDRRAWLDWITATKEPFVGQRAYVYPIYWRDRTWLEYLPFWPEPPNEQAATPVGAPALPTASNTPRS
ncbi:MAG: HEAT repeat domain-containing protein [Phycisphaerales bacterium]|nr:HEAT repeat domain-containing protein [Phycisphaerales bacterium]